MRYFRVSAAPERDNHTVVSLHHRICTYASTHLAHLLRSLHELMPCTLEISFPLLLHASIHGMLTVLETHKIVCVVLVADILPFRLLLQRCS